MEPAEDITYFRERIEDLSEEITMLAALLDSDIDETIFEIIEEQLLVVGGSFGLREFTQIRYDAQKIQRKKLKDANLSDWKNIRGPRPWENSREYQEQQRTIQRDMQEKGL
ncbi:COX16 protein, partial [Polypterus senegalus]